MKEEEEEEEELDCLGSAPLPSWPGKDQVIRENNFICARAQG
jgi:hypothetical protein